MQIATCSTYRQHSVQKATTTKTATPKDGKRQSERQLSKSPTSVDVNTILADINLPQTRFENILTVLGHAAEKNDEMEDNPAPPEDNNPADEEVDEDNPSFNQVSPPTSPNLDPTCNATVRINKTPDLTPQGVIQQQQGPLDLFYAVPLQQRQLNRPQQRLQTSKRTTAPQGR